LNDALVPLTRTLAVSSAMSTSTASLRARKSAAWRVRTVRANRFASRRTPSRGSSG
jgi:hypothetical protein